MNKAVRQFNHTLYAKRKFIFSAAAVLSILTAGYHVLHLLYLPGTGSAARHIVFTLISLSAAVLFLKRPVFFPPLFLLLTAQQLYSHGNAFIRRWQLHQFDWISLAVIILLPFFLYLLLLERQWYRITHQAGHEKN